MSRTPSIATLLLLGSIPPRPGNHRLGWALVDSNAEGDLFVHEQTIRVQPAVDASFGYDGDDEDDDEFGEDDAGDDGYGDDEAGDDGYGDDEAGDDEAGDDGTGGPRGRARRARNLRRRAAKLEAPRGRRNRRAARRTASGEMTDKSISGVGTVLGTVGLANTMSVTPKSSFWLRRIVASGDTAAVLTTVFAGEVPIVIDPIDTAILTAGSFHAPTFKGKKIRAGVPITVNYTVGSTTVALRLTFLGRGKAQSC